MNLALFDLDGTLLATDSDHAFGEFMVRLGWADGDDWAARNDAFFRQYENGTLDLHAYVDFATAAWRDRDPRSIDAARERFMREIVRPSLAEPALALVRSHLEAGDLVAIVTATNEFVTRPIADAFGVEHLLAVELERDAAGRVTGRVHGTPTFRAGKIERLQGWLAGRGQSLEGFERSVFYSDSINDAPLLERVSEPVATNACPALAALAKARGWRTMELPA